jgi:hypothetical protein
MEEGPQMAQKKQSDGKPAASDGAPVKDPVDATPTPNQILQGSWGTTMDAQAAQQFSGLTQIRQARANQLQREFTVLQKAYGSDDAGVQAVKASLAYEQTFGSRLGVVSATTSRTAPSAPANGWVVYGRVRNADLTPAPQLTVFLADEGRSWLNKYGYAFTDASGYFALSYAGAAPKKAQQAEAAAPEALNAYLEVSNSNCQLMYIDATTMALTVGAVVYRDIVLSDKVPLGSAPCEHGAPPTVPPAQK